MNKIKRVLVIDDSAYIRKVVTQMLSRSPFLEVVGTARNGKDALEKVELLNPDVCTCDLIMPEMDGVEFVREQMKRRHIPIIIMSIASETAEMALTALEVGAIDFVQKPTALATDKILDIADELINKVKVAAEIPTSHLPAVELVEPKKVEILEPQKGAVDIVVIGISTGGPQALRYVIPQIPANIGVPMAVVMHMPIGYTEMYALKLNETAKVEFREAAEGDELKAGTVLLAPAGRHMTLKRTTEGTVVAHLDARPFETLHRPSVDVLFQSAAEVYGQRSLGIVMTGMGSDGREGASWIKARGGLVYTESEETCVVYGMPRATLEAGLSDKVVPLHQMAQAIWEVV
ncbi:MAG TPA: chemotaxis-specific protein-glutamate methyltransferase CheB [Pyrinomonadaceae bacterium]